MLNIPARVAAMSSSCIAAQIVSLARRTANEPLGGGAMDSAGADPNRIEQATSHLCLFRAFNLTCTFVAAKHQDWVTDPTRKFRLIPVKEFLG